MKLTKSHRKILLACREWCIPDGARGNDVRDMDKAGYLDHMTVRQGVDPWFTLAAYRTNNAGDREMWRAGYDPMTGKASEPNPRP